MRETITCAEPARDGLFVQDACALCLHLYPQLQVSLTIRLSCPLSEIPVLIFRFDRFAHDIGGA